MENISSQSQQEVSDSESFKEDYLLAKKALHLMGLFCFTLILPDKQEFSKT